MVGTGGKESEDIEVITDTDILAVSDSACVAAAHTCAAHNLVAGKVKQFAATLQPGGQAGKFTFLLFHINYWQLLWSYLNSVS
jgi:hypothetical protein